MKATEGIARLGMILAALASVSYLAVVAQNAEAQGALISVLAAGVGWAFRGRVEATK